MTRPLDFIVIGAQKAGTTSLWRYLRSHPAVFCPAVKEAPFFVGPEVGPVEFDAYMRRVFAEVPPQRLLGKATPDYMLGRRDVTVEEVARRIGATLPEVRLIVLLRDPVERAVSSHTMEVRRGHERRTLDAALEQELAPASLDAARRFPTFVNSYVVGGEYGRVLDAFMAHVSPQRMLVEQSRDFADRPAEVLDRVLSFLGLPPGHRPVDLGVRYFRGGTRSRIDPEARAELFDYFQREVLPHVEGDPTLHANAFGLFFTTWNVVPDETPPWPSAELVGRLREHYLEDARRLQGLGVAAPWVASWSHGVRP